MIEEALRSFLIADTPVAEVVAERVHVNRQPQGGRQPSIVLKRISTVDGTHLKGVTGLKDVRIQIDCRAETAAAAIALAGLVRAAGGTPSLKAFSGAMGGVYVRRGIFVDERGTVGQPVHADDKPLHVQELDWMVLYSEDDPCEGA